MFIETSRNADVESALHSAPGVEVLATLSRIDPGLLSPVDRIDYLTALEKQNGWLQALMQRAIIAVAGAEASESTEPLYGVDEAEREDVSTALRLAPATAQMRIDVARTLTNHLPNTCSALATGEISPAHATVIAREAASAIKNGISEYAIFEIEQKALAHAEFHTPAQVANKVRSTIAKFSPEEFAETVSSAREMRRVSCYNDADGMSTVVAILPAEDAQIVMNAIESFILATKDGGNLDGGKYGSKVEESDTTGSGSDSNGRGISTSSNFIRDERTKDQLRADALTFIASQYLTKSGEKVKSHRRPLTVNVTIDLPTLLGLAENPGELAGYGAIPAEVARTLASDATWKRFVTDPISGNLLDFGRSSYEPPQILKDFLIARDRTCRFPGCRRSATLSDLDHAQSWDDGGHTSAENLGALCRRHHRMKTHDGWKVESFPDGSCTWTSPLGKEFFTPARSVGETV